MLPIEHACYIPVPGTWYVHDLIVRHPPGVFPYLCFCIDKSSRLRSHAASNKPLNSGPRARAVLLFSSNSTTINNPTDWRVAVVYSRHYYNHVVGSAPHHRIMRPVLSSCQEPNITPPSSILAEGLGPSPPAPAPPPTPSLSLRDLCDIAWLKVGLEVTLSHAVQQKSSVLLLQLPPYCHDGDGSLNGCRWMSLSCRFFRNLRWEEGGTQRL